MKKPNMVFYQRTKDEATFMSMDSNKEFRALPPRSQMAFMNQCGRILMQMIKKIEKSEREKHGRT